MCVCVCGCVFDGISDPPELWCIVYCQLQLPPPPSPHMDTNYPFSANKEALRSEDGAGPNLFDLTDLLVQFAPEKM